MTKAILDAHMRMLSSLPIRTHHCALPSERLKGDRIGREIPRQVLEEFAQLRAAGLRCREIVRVMRIGTKTFQRLQLALSKKLNAV